MLAHLIRIQKVSVSNLRRVIYYPDIFSDFPQYLEPVSEVNIKLATVASFRVISTFFENILADQILLSGVIVAPIPEVRTAAMLVLRRMPYGVTFIQSFLKILLSVQNLLRGGYHTYRQMDDTISLFLC
jgi:hypothetical protein